MLKLLLIVHLGLVSASVFQVDTEHGTLTLEGIHRRGTKTNIVGAFTTKGDDNVGGVRFRSTAYSVDIATLDGEVLVKASSFSVATQTYDDEEEEETAIYQILDDVFVEANGLLYRSSESVHPVEHDEFARSQLLSSLQASAALENPRDEFRASVERLAGHPATKLLEPAAFALGEKLGINGDDEPAVMPFYTISMTLTEASKRKQRPPVYMSYSDSVFDKRQADSQGKYPNCNVKVCPPCKEDECYGMCGYGCTCWKHLCKDCCYHKGCRDHDKCCRRDGFFSPSCVLPFWFKCNKRFKCKLTP